MAIDIAAKQAGIELERDVPKPGQRRTRDWATLIGTARKLEAQEAQEHREAHRKIEELSVQVVKLTKENADLLRQVELFRLKERLESIELPAKDSRFLLTGKKEVA